MKKKHILIFISLLAISTQFYCRTITVKNKSDYNITFYLACHGTIFSRKLIEQRQNKQMSVPDRINCPLEIRWRLRNGQLTGKAIPGNTKSITILKKRWRYHTRKPGFKSLPRTNWI